VIIIRSHARLFFLLIFSFGDGSLMDFPVSTLARPAGEPVFSIENEAVSPLGGHAAPGCEMQALVPSRLTLLAEHTFNTTV
jgi:hypothetical protein